MNRIEVWCSGRNDHGQLGNGTMEDKFTLPETFPGVELPVINFEEERKVLDWCKFSTIIDGITATACGSMHLMILGKDIPPSHSTKSQKEIGTLFSTGSNNTGQLGHDNKVGQSEPLRVETIYQLSGDVKSIACGDKHNIAISNPPGIPAETEIWTWGQGWYGRLGHGSERFQLRPKRIASFKGPFNFSKNFIFYSERYGRSANCASLLRREFYGGCV